MAFSYNEVGPVDPGFTTVTLTFPFLERTHVSVSVDRIVIPDNAWAWNSDTQIELNDPLVGGEVVKVFRTTPAAGVQADFQPGAFDYEELNTSLLHLLYIVQEAYDNSSVAVEAGNNAFSYLIQIEDMYDDLIILSGDMQALYAQYGTQATAALTALSLARGNALADLAAALSSALAAISTDRSGALSAIATALSSALSDIASARSSAITAINALVTTAEGHKNAAATSASNAATSETNAAASVVGAVKANVVQAFSTAEKLQARVNIDIAYPVQYRGDLGVGAVSIDTLFTPGVYSKNSSANASPTYGYPLVNRAGVLTVYNLDTAGGTASYVVHRYQLYDNRIFERMYVVGTGWSPWGEVGAKPAFQAYASGSQSVPGATYTKVQFATTDITFGGYWTGGATSRFLPSPGRYRLSAMLWMAGTDSASYMELLFVKNGVLLKTSDRLVTPAAISPAVTKATVIVEANGTDYFEVFTRHGNGAALLYDSQSVFSAEAL